MTETNEGMNKNSRQAIAVKTLLIPDKLDEGDIMPDVVLRTWSFIGSLVMSIYFKISISIQTRLRGDCLAALGL